EPRWLSLEARPIYEVFIANPREDIPLRDSAIPTPPRRWSVTTSPTKPARTSSTRCWPSWTTFFPTGTTGPGPKLARCPSRPTVRPGVPPRRVSATPCWATWKSNCWRAGTATNCSGWRKPSWKRKNITHDPATHSGQGLPVLPRRAGSGLRRRLPVDADRPQRQRQIDRVRRGDLRPVRPAPRRQAERQGTHQQGQRRAGGRVRLSPGRPVVPGTPHAEKEHPQPPANPPLETCPGRQRPRRLGGGARYRLRERLQRVGPRAHRPDLRDLYLVGVAVAGQGRETAGRRTRRALPGAGRHRRPRPLPALARARRRQTPGVRGLGQEFAPTTGRRSRGDGGRVTGSGSPDRGRRHCQKGSAGRGRTAATPGSTGGTVGRVAKP